MYIMVLRTVLINNICMSLCSCFPQSSFHLATIAVLAVAVAWFADIIWLVSVCVCWPVCSITDCIMNGKSNVLQLLMFLASSTWFICYFSTYISIAQIFKSSKLFVDQEAA